MPRGKQIIELKLFSEGLVVSQGRTNHEFIVLIKNISDKKVAILSPEIINVGSCTSSWNLKIFFDGKEKCIFKFDMPKWGSYNNYNILKPLQTHYFNIRVNFNDLNNCNLVSNIPKEQITSLSEILEVNNSDFGIYEIWLEYNDKVQKRKIALKQVIKSNLVTVDYLK